MVEQLTAVLAERVMNWEVAPGRFLLSKRRWLPRWRFQPTERIEDAFRLLDQSGAQEYSMGIDRRGLFWVRVLLKGKTGTAQGQSKPRVITLAIARSLGIDAKLFD
jgi:hypothetical protein